MTEPVEATSHTAFRNHGIVAKQLSFTGGLAQACLQRAQLGGLRGLLQAIKGGRGVVEDGERLFAQAHGGQHLPQQRTDNRNAIDAL